MTYNDRITNPADKMGRERSPMTNRSRCCRDARGTGGETQMTSTVTVESPGVRLEDRNYELYEG